MLYSYISNLNWVDILIVVIVLRMCFVGIQRGFGVEFFKIFNILFCIFISLHFYFTLAEIVHTKIPALPVEPAAILTYIFLLFVITMLFRILREGFFLLVKSETVTGLSKCLGLIMGFSRGVLISGLILFGLLISTVYYPEQSTRTSSLGLKVVRLPIKIYEGLFNGMVTRIFPEQGFNQEVNKVLEEKPAE